MKNKMGKAFGITSLVLGIIGIIIGIITFLSIFFPLPYMRSLSIGTFGIGGLAITFGAIGIAKDDSKGLGIAGLVLGISAVFIGISFWLSYILMSYARSQANQFS